MSEVPAPELSVLVLQFRKGVTGSGDVFVEKLRDVEIWLLRCGFRDPALVAMDVDIGHGEGFGGETESVSH